MPIHWITGYIDIQISQHEVLHYQLSAAKEHDLLDKFEHGLLNTTDIEIDLSKLISDDPLKKAINLEYKEIKSLARL